MISLCIVTIGNPHKLSGFPSIYSKRLKDNMRPHDFETPRETYIYDLKFSLEKRTFSTQKGAVNYRVIKAMYSDIFFAC